jgi:hypothetical protein
MFVRTPLVTAGPQAAKRAERRFALRLRLRSVTDYGGELPPGSHSRQAEAFPALADYRAAPATYAATM